MRVRGNKKYSDDFKAEALALIHRDERSFRQLAEDLGVNAWTLRDWYKKDLMAKKGKSGSRDPKQVVSASETPEQLTARLERENERLRKENESLKMDREILKKGKPPVRPVSARVIRHVTLPSRWTCRATPMAAY